MRLSDDRLGALELSCAVGACNADVTGKDLIALVAEVRAMRAVEKAAEDFVQKVDSGRAHSVDSYAKFSAALAGVRALGEEKP